MKAEEKQSFIQGRLAKSEAIVNEVSNLIRFGYLETCVNRCYYCCFYCAQVLLAKVEVYPKSHRGVISMFDLHYAKTEIFPTSGAAFLHQLFNQRQLVDYGDAYLLSQAMVEEFLTNTKLFLQKTKDILQKHE